MNYETPGAMGRQTVLALSATCPGLLEVRRVRRRGQGAASGGKFPIIITRLCVESSLFACECLPLFMDEHNVAKQHSQRGIRLVIRNPRRSSMRGFISPI